MPIKYSLPSEMGEAILLVETGWTPEEIDNASENLLSNMLLYKAIKQVSQYGGELDL